MIEPADELTVKEDIELRWYMKVSQINYGFCISQHCASPQQLRLVCRDTHFAYMMWKLFKSYFYHFFQEEPPNTHGGIYVFQNDNKKYVLEIDVLHSSACFDILKFLERYEKCFDKIFVKGINQRIYYASENFITGVKTDPLDEHIKHYNLETEAFEYV